ncbi:hypothetical protein GGG16DRAFT_125541 [Schizophyllum commune]
MTFATLAATAIVAGVTSVFVLIWGCNDANGCLGIDWLSAEMYKYFGDAAHWPTWTSSHEGWRDRATPLEPLALPEKHLFTSNLLFIITEVGVDRERVLLAVFLTPDFEKSSSPHIEDGCPSEAALDGVNAGSLPARQDDGDEGVNRHIAVDDKGRVWRLDPADFLAFRDLARAAEAEIGDVESYTVASEESCTPTFSFIYPVSGQATKTDTHPASIDSLSDNAVNHAAVFDPIYRGIHGGTTSDATEGYTILHEVDVNAYTRFCRQLAPARPPSTGGGREQDGKPGELPGALHELLGLAEEWPKDCENETEDNADSELLRATMARVETIRSWALELRWAH